MEIDVSTRKKKQAILPIFVFKLKQMFKKMTKDGLAWQFQLKIEILASYDFYKIVTYRALSLVDSFHFLWQWQKML